MIVYNIRLGYHPRPVASGSPNVAAGSGPDPQAIPPVPGFAAGRHHCGCCRRHWADHVGYVGTPPDDARLGTFAFPDAPLYCPPEPG